MTKVVYSVLYHKTSQEVVKLTGLGYLENNSLKFKKYDKYFEFEDIDRYCHKIIGTDDQFKGIYPYYFEAYGNTMIKDYFIWYKVIDESKPYVREDKEEHKQTKTVEQSTPQKVEVDLSDIAVNSKVNHKKLGVGKITKFEGNQYIFVQFKNEPKERKFSYPTCFEYGFLTLKKLSKKKQNLNKKLTSKQQSFKNYKIEICNLKTTTLQYECDVKVDRSSILGNPFHMQYESQRNQVCDQYQTYFYQQLVSNKQFRDEIYRLYDILKTYGTIRLFCHCAPKRCHAETIKNYLNSIIKGDM